MMCKVICAKQRMAPPSLDSTMHANRIEYSSTLCRGRAALLKDARAAQQISRAILTLIQTLIVFRGNGKVSFNYYSRSRLK